MDYKKLRKISLKLFCGFLVLTALIAIVSVLTGSFGELQLKILATTFTISAASICAMSCAAFIEKKRLVKPGLVGIFLSAGAACLVIAGLWVEVRADEYWKTAVTLIVLAAGSAHASLLALPELEKKHKWLAKVSCITIGALALKIIFAVWLEIRNETYYRILVVVAIIVALETLIIPILAKLRGAEEKKEELVLRKEKDGIYKDPSGRLFYVSAVSNGLPDGKERTDNVTTDL